MAIFIFWVIFSILVGIYAKNKNKGGLAAFFLSLLFTPLVGFIITLIAKPKNMKECPDCKELIKEDALKCHYCGKVFKTEVSEKPIPTGNVFTKKINFRDFIVWIKKVWRLILSHPIISGVLIAIAIFLPIALISFLNKPEIIQPGPTSQVQNNAVSNLTPPTSQTKSQAQQQSNATNKKVGISSLTNLPNYSLVKLYGKVTRSATYGKDNCIFIIYDGTGKSIILTTDAPPSICPQEGPWAEVNGVYVKEGMPTCGDSWVTSNTKSNPTLTPQLRNICNKFNIDPATSVVASHPSAIYIDGKPLLSKSTSQSQLPQVQKQPVSYNWSDFSKINFSDYAKNPPAYLNQQIKFSGMVTDFLAAGDRGGDTNYIAITDYTNPVALKIMMLRIDDSSEYKKATASLNAASDFIVVYGTGVVSQTSTNGITTPVIKVLRLDKCDLTTDAFCSDGTTQILFP